MDLTFLPKVEIRSSEVTAGRLSCHTLLRNCPYPVLRKLSTHKNATSNSHSHCHWPDRAPAGPDHLCLLPGSSDANQEVRLLSQCVCEALPCGWKGEACTGASGAQWLGCQGCRVPRAVPSLGMSLLMAIVSLPQSRGCAQKEDGWGPRRPPV